MVHETQPSEILPMSPVSVTPVMKFRPKILQHGMSIVDHDLDLEEDGNGVKKLNL